MARTPRSKPTPPPVQESPLELDLLPDLLSDGELASDGETLTLPATLPLVPIRDNVYFPHMLFPLLVGRDRSVRAVEAALESGERRIVLASQKEIATEDPDPEDIYGIGVLAEVMQILRLPDNAIRVMLSAGKRVHLSAYPRTEPYLIVRAESVPEPSGGSDIEIESLVRVVTGQFERMVIEGKSIPPESLISILNLSDASEIADSIIPYLNLRINQKQSLLETLSIRERLERLIAALAREQEILEIQKNIRNRVESEMGDNQREFLLREQMKAIQSELGERDDQAQEISDLREKIELAGMPEAVQEKALKELDRYERTPPASPESGVLRNYLDWLTEMPWNKLAEEKLEMAEAEEILNTDHCGLDKVKERILEFLAVRKLSGGKTKSPILCFVGPPGVGKTSLGRSVARSLGRPFVRISLGGVRDEAEIRGHRRTYVGALPGRIVQAIRQCGMRNPVFLLDEVDKIGTDFRGDPSSALLEALDPEQNSEFSDHYLEVPFDLSSVLFIATANLMEPIPPALRDRMEIISFSGYIEAEKLDIASRHLAPRQITENGLTAGAVFFAPDALLRIIREYTREAGVRNLEREIGSICRKIARRFAGGKAEETQISAEAVSQYLGRPKIRWGVAEEKDEIGAATGLAYTEAGGDTMTIEVGLTPAPEREGRLTLTGQVGDVMKESAQAAWTFVRSRLTALGARRTRASAMIFIFMFRREPSLKIASAGVTIAVALASALTNRPVRKDIAMTGEITLRGKALPVGGVKEKVLAAHRAGIRHVLLPAENERDLEDLPMDVRQEMTFLLLSNADEALSAALK